MAADAVKGRRNNKRRRLLWPPLCPVQHVQHARISRANVCHTCHTYGLHIVTHVSHISQACVTYVSHVNHTCHTWVTDGRRPHTDPGDVVQPPRRGPPHVPPRGGGSRHPADEGGHEVGRVQPVGGAEGGPVCARSLQIVCMLACERCLLSIIIINPKICARCHFPAFLADPPPPDPTGAKNQRVSQSPPGGGSDAA